MTLKEIKARLAKATPGRYEARVKEFSNHALPEIWTEFGWLSELPKSYRVPTVEMLAHARTDIEKLVKLVELYQGALELASVRLGILTGRMAACNEETKKHELLDEAEMFCSEAKQALADGEKIWRVF